MNQNAPTVLGGRIWAGLLGGLIVLIVCASSFAGSTKLWELAGFNELSLGQFDGTVLSSDGQVSIGKTAQSIDMENVGLVWCAVKDSKGKVYLGSAYDGKIFRVDNGKAVLIANTGQIVITDMVFDAKGNLFVAALPEAVIWKINQPSKISPQKPAVPEKWSIIAAPQEMKESQADDLKAKRALKDKSRHVWSLAFGKQGKTLFAGTGPDGKIFAVGKDGKASVYLDTEEEHILSLLWGGKTWDGKKAGGKNVLIAGTSPSALLLEVNGPGRYRALMDFEATEVKDIVTRNNELVVAVNSFSSSSSVSLIKSKTAQKTTKKIKTLGKGFLFSVGQDGKVEKLFENKKAHINALAASQNGTVYIGMADKGKVMSVDMNRIVKTILDLDQRQVMAVLAADELNYVATGDAGAVYKIKNASKGQATYLTPPLDTTRSSRFGRLQWFGRGRLVAQYRQGNTKVPDNSWTDWSKEIGNDISQEKLNATASRYFQLRFSWRKDSRAVLESVALSYQSVNLRAVITNFDPSSPFSDVGASKAKAFEDSPSTRTINGFRPLDYSEKLKLSWNVQNIDGDTLRYRLWYKAQGQTLWRPIFKETTIYTKKNYSWQTTAVPDGYYQFKLSADDSPSNDLNAALFDEMVSVPVLIDNHQPEVVSLNHKGDVLTGEAKDGFTAISAFKISIDGGPWKPVFCSDGIFDDKVERFEYRLPKDLKPGPHAISVRAYDRGMNVGSKEILITIK